MNLGSVATSGTERAILGASLLFGALYLLDTFGFSAPYPADVVIKATGIILLGVYALIARQHLLAVGLFAGSAGDAFLALQPQQLELGIAAFGIGHIIYIVLFAQIMQQKGNRGLPGWLGAAAIGVFGIAMLSYLLPHFGDMLVPASIYNAIILIMAALAVAGRAPRMALAGALLFVLSDSVLATRMFAGELEWAGWVVWATYYLGQAGIAMGLVDGSR